MMPLGLTRRIAAHPDMMPHREAREKAKSRKSSRLVGSLEENDDIEEV